jgi:hypothetical protein
VGNAAKILKFPTAAAKRTAGPAIGLAIEQIEHRRRKALARARRLFAEGKLDQTAEMQIVLELARLLVARRQRGP